MKNIIVILFITSLFACNDILEERPQSIAEETFYNTSSE